MFSWKEWYACLESMISENEPPSWGSDELYGSYLLRVWFIEQQLAYLNGTLSMEQRQALEAIPGWRSGIKEQVRWHDFFEHLKNFVDTEGHSQVPRHYEVEGFLLGVWVQEQRELYYREELPKYLIQKLESLQGWTWWSKPTTIQ